MAIYRNVDVEVRSDEDLAELRDAIDRSDAAGVLHFGPLDGNKFGLTFEAASSAPAPDGDTLRLCALIESLPPPARKIWDGAKDRVFDFGFDSTDSKTNFCHALLSSKALKAVGAVGARIAISIYPVMNETSEETELH